MSAGAQQVSEHDRTEVGTRVAVTLLVDNLCFPDTGHPQTRARQGAVKLRASLAITRALRQAGLR